MINISRELKDPTDQFFIGFRKRYPISIIKQIYWRLYKQLFDDIYRILINNNYV